MLVSSKSRPWEKQECELVAISTFETHVSSVPGLLGARLRFVERLQQTQATSETLVNVMWIGRKDGVAHRKGMGVMLAEEWDSLSPEMMDITIM